MVEKPPRNNPKSDRPTRPEQARQAFAEGIARAEFGRFYWSERSERALAEARTRKPVRPKAGRD